MTWRPSNKALAVLEVLRELGELSANGVAEAIQERTPCGLCQGTGEGEDPRWGCRRCYGRGRVLFAYSDAYTALMQLMRAGLVTRRNPVDEFGDPLRAWVWSAAPDRDRALSADELEALYRAPSAEEPAH